MVKKEDSDGDMKKHRSHGSVPTFKKSCQRTNTNTKSSSSDSTNNSGSSAPPQQTLQWIQTSTCWILSQTTQKAWITNVLNIREALEFPIKR